MTDQDVVKIAQRGAALWARIARPDAGNACSSAVMAHLEHWLDRADEPEVRVLVLTGTGRSFCAGADLAEGTALLDDPPALHRFLERGRDLVRRVARAPVPTVAAVNGAAFGGGLELVLACDVALAGTSARLGDRHIGVGQVPGWGSSAMLPQAVGPTMARRLLLTGETWSAEQAARHGLVSEVVADAELDARAGALAESLAGHDQAALQGMLGLVRADREAHETAWSREWDTLLAHLARQRPDSRDGVLGLLKQAASTHASEPGGTEES